MLTGAAQADVAVLVVDSIKGEFEAGFQDQGQTKEHALLLRSVGVKQLVVAVNKMDTIGWNKARFDEIQGMLRTYLRSLSFKDKNVQYVPVSGLTGENLVKPSKDEQLTAWYKGPTLLQLIDRFKPPSRSSEKPLRLPISDVYKPQYGPITVCGKIETGALMVKDELLLMPLNVMVNVSRIHKTRGSDDSGQVLPSAAASGAQVAGPGESVEIGLTTADSKPIAKGQILCDPEHPVPILTRFRARISALEFKLPLVKGSPLVMHVHNVDRECSIRKLISLLDRKTGEVMKKKPRLIGSMQSAEVEIECKKPVCLETVTECKQLGKFQLRRESKTVAFGTVTEIVK